jgi:hypothetical protein
VTGWLAPSTGQKNPVQPGWYLPPRKIPLAGNRFLEAGNGAENTKEKSRQSFIYVFLKCRHKPVEEKIRLLLSMPSNDIQKIKGSVQWDGPL